MPAANITRNRKRFVKEILDTANGEEILGGSADGEVQIVYGYNSFYNGQEKAPKPPKAYHMSLFPTGKRIVVYQANSFLSKDRYAQLPISEIEKIAYYEVHGKKRTACVTEFIAADDSNYPSIIFNMDCTGHPDDLKQYMVILRGVAKLAGVPIDNFTKHDEEQG